jgi:5,10-methylenetetrahydrofolate reductase
MTEGATAGMRTFEQKLLDKRFPVTIECNPPKGGDLAPALSRLKPFAGRVDAINVTDSPMAKARMSAIAASAVIERETGIETIFNFTCRDRNLIALHADLLGAHALGLRNVLCVTGDPTSLGDWKDAKGVFEFNSGGLLKLACALNEGTDHAGKPLLAGGTSLFPGAVCYPSAPSLEAEVRETVRKSAAGARFFLTQPVFDAAEARAFLEAARGAGVTAPILFGVMPLKSVAFAKYLDEHVPGIRIPAPVLDRLAAAPEAQAADEGVRIAAALSLALRGFADGLHLMPTGPLESALAILDALER